MKKQMKKIFFGSLAIIATCIAITGCGPKTEEEKVPEDIKLVYTTEDGTQVNQSEKIINETKKLGELEFSNISITESGNLTKIKCDISNTSGNILNEKEFSIILLNTENEEVKKIKGYIGTILPGATQNWGMETTLDYTEVYDIKFVE